MPKSWRLLAPTVVCGNATPCSFSLSSILQGCSQFCVLAPHEDTLTSSLLHAHCPGVRAASSLRWMAVHMGPGRRAGLLTWSICSNPKPSWFSPDTHSLSKAQALCFVLSASLLKTNPSGPQRSKRNSNHAGIKSPSLTFFSFIPLLTDNPAPLYSDFQEYLDPERSPTRCFLEKPHWIPPWPSWGHTIYHHLNRASELRYAEEERVLIYMLDSGQIHSARICEGSS